MSDKALAVLESRLRRGLWIEREGKKDGSNYCSSKEASTMNQDPVFVALGPQEATVKGLLTSLFL